MKKLLIFVFGCLSVNMYYSQIESKRILDSISAENWKKNIPNLDSLAEINLQKIDVKHKDTIILKTDKITAELGTELPITPFQLIKTKEEKVWYFYGQNNMVFNQASFSNWNSGGNNNIGILGKINYNLSFKKRKHYLENNFQLGYGIVAASGQTTRKTEDFINIMANYGYDLGKNYYLSSGLQFISQFAPGYNYVKTPSPNFDDRISKFLAPAYINTGIGISYNPNENFQVIFRPINGKFTIVADKHLQKVGFYGLEKDGQSLRKELGAMVNILYRQKIYKDINLVNQFNFFANYLYHTERVDFSYNGQLNFRVNKLISANVSADLLYDHDQIKRMQFKQTLGIGFSYNLGIENQDKPKVKKVVKPFL